jgi:hypothetical protein
MAGWVWALPVIAAIAAILGFGGILAVATEKSVERWGALIDVPPKK